ncbi:MAG: sodium/solute symporter [Planctomycetaceae bacterium]|nr:sodium/solute symporter [Planctomycetaceae bacterium]
MSPLDYLVVIAYLLMTVALGAWFGRHQSRDEFFEASRSMGRLTVGLSVMATLFSSNSFVFYPSIVYGDSLKIWLTLIAHTAIFPLIVWVFIPMFSRLNCPTAYEYLERRFHVSIRCLASGLFILLRIGWMASATFAASLVLAAVSGVDQGVVIISLGVVSILYTMMGGLRAVMWTDVIQFFIFSLTILLALGLLVSQQSGGFLDMFEKYTSDRPHMLVDWTPSVTLQFGSWAVLFGIFLEALSAFGADQVAVQRYLAADSEQTSQNGFVITILGIWFVVPALLIIGVGLYGYYGEHPGDLHPLLAEAGMKDSALAAASPTDVHDEMVERGLQDKAFPVFVKDHFPPGTIGLFLAALMAAIMSSIDSGIHSVTTAFVVDFRDRLLPHLKPEDEKEDVRLIRGLIVGIGAVSVTLALYVGPLGDVFTIGKMLTAAFGGPLLAVFLLAFFSPKVTTPGVFLGTIFSAAATLACMFVFDDWFSVWFWPIGFGLAMLLSWGLSLILGKPHGDEFTYRSVVKQPE